MCVCASGESSEGRTGETPEKQRKCSGAHNERTRETDRLPPAHEKGCGGNCTLPARPFRCNTVGRSYNNLSCFISSRSACAPAPTQPACTGNCYFRSIEKIRQRSFYFQCRLPTMCACARCLSWHFFAGRTRGLGTRPSRDPDPLSDTIVRQTDFDVTIGQYVVPDRNLARAILKRHKAMSDGDAKVRLVL